MEQKRRSKMSVQVEKENQDQNPPLSPSENNEGGPEYVPLEIYRDAVSRTQTI
jgi:hypothetical protein